MPEKTKQSAKIFTTLEATRVSTEDELQSAKILVREGLIEEAKKKLYQILIARPNFQRAQELLKQIQDDEMKEMLNESVPSGKVKRFRTENSENLIAKLNADLGLDLNLDSLNPDIENWISDSSLTPQSHYDLGVAFFEMGCYRDAVRELKYGEKKIRIAQSFLGELGVAIVALYAESLLLLNDPFTAKVHLAPILNEPDLKIEEKVVLFYAMGRIEEALSDFAPARGWYHRVLQMDPHFRDALHRVKQLP